MATIIKGRTPEHAMLLDPSCSGIPFDVTFMIENTNVDDFGDTRKEIKAHKFLLAALSPVFKGMFFGPMKDDKNVVTVKETTYEAFEKLVEYIYQIDIDCNNMKLLEFYEIVNLAKMYDMPKLMDELKIQMENIPLSMENLVDVAHTATQYSQFDEVSPSLLLACAKFLQKSIGGPAQRLRFAVDQYACGRGDTALELLAMLLDLPPLECYNCGEKDCLTGQTVAQEKITRDLKVKVNNGEHAIKRYTVVRGVSANSTVTVRDEDTGTFLTGYNIVNFCYNC